MLSDYDKRNSPPMVTDNDTNLLSPPLTNGHGDTTPAVSSRQYSCKACYYSTASLLQFLMHVEKKHFDCHTSKSDTSSHYAATPDVERKESSEAQENSEPSTHVESLAISAENATDDLVPLDTSTGDETDTLKTDDPNNKVKHEVVVDGKVIDLSFLPVSSTAPTPEGIEADPTTEPANLREENALTHLQKITESVTSSMDNNKVNTETQLSLVSNPGKSITTMSTNPQKNSVQTNGRGIKIDSIANSLQECNAIKTVSDQLLRQCNICSNFLAPHSSQCQNCAQSFNTPNIQPIQVPRVMSENAASAFPYRQSCLPQFRPSVIPQYPLLTETAARLKQFYCHDNHFRSLQSLMSSASVSMPHTPILQSIHCDKDTWRDIQETLHQAFSSFPYLSPQESSNLSNMTGLSVQQVKTLFVVARLQHGISWDQEEIKSSRKFLGIPKNRFDACYT